VTFRLRIARPGLADEVLVFVVVAVVTAAGNSFNVSEASEVADAKVDGFSPLLLVSPMFACKKTLIRNAFAVVGVEQITTNVEFFWYDLFCIKS
jgi:hypothetical protein